MKYILVLLLVLTSASLNWSDFYDTFRNKYGSEDYPVLMSPLPKIPEEICHDCSEIYFRHIHYVGYRGYYGILKQENLTLHVSKGTYITKYIQHESSGLVLDIVISRKGSATIHFNNPPTKPPIRDGFSEHVFNEETIQFGLHKLFGLPYFAILQNKPPIYSMVIPRMKNMELIGMEVIVGVCKTKFGSVSLIIEGWTKRDPDELCFMADYRCTKELDEIKAFQEKNCVTE